ncbi:MAG: hypothetical protein ABG776_11865 [Cyanobacteria bacterium J06555_13]
MSPAEHIELINQSFELTANGTMNYIAVLFAYLGTAFSVGSRLTKFQVWSLTALYTVFLSFPGTAAVTNNLKVIALRKWFAEEYPDESARISVESARISGELSLEAVYLFGAILIIAWMLSLLFMFYSRRNEDVLEDTKEGAILPLDDP